MVLLALPIVSCSIVYGENQIEYTIQIESDGTAVWIITETGTSVTVSPNPLADLENRLMPLVVAAENETQRGMAVEMVSYKYDRSGSYVVAEYVFFWENFSKIENTRIVVGDAFQVEDFFLQLYGEGEVYMTYPSEYIVENVLPTPHERDDSLQTLRWLGTRDFAHGQPMVILTRKSSTSGFFEILAQNAVPIGGSVALVAGSSVGFYIFRRRKKKKMRIGKIPEFPEFLGVESDEEKAVKLLKSSGGSLYQSVITEKCRFSKAKTSQLLAILENKGIVRRYKKGRVKIVVLIEQDKK